MSKRLYKSSKYEYAKAPKMTIRRKYTAVINTMLNITILEFLVDFKNVGKEWVVYLSHSLSICYTTQM